MAFNEKRTPSKTLSTDFLTLSEKLLYWISYVSYYILSMLLQRDNACENFRMLLCINKC